jgi:hypothetical protein
MARFRRLGKDSDGMTQTYLKVLVPRSQKKWHTREMDDFADTYASIVLDVLVGAWENRKGMEKG